jgi:hypothetical protein
MKLFKSKAFFISLLIIIATVIYFVVSDSKNFVPKRKSTENCITISRSKINAWLASGWNRRDDANYIPAIVFVPVPGDPISVLVYPVDKDCNMLTSKMKKMTITNPSSPAPRCNFPANLHPGYSRYDFAASDVTASGKLINFDFLRLIPKADITDPTKLVFEVQLVTEETSRDISVAKGDTKPCPPYCPVQ